MRAPRTGLVLPFAAALLAACGDDGPAAVAVAGGRPEVGRALLARYQCVACHRIPGVEGVHGNAGPALELVGRTSYIAGHIPNYPDAMQRWIVDPAALKPGTAMPSMGVPAADARDMAAYLYTLR